MAKDKTRRAIALFSMVTIATAIIAILPLVNAAAVPNRKTAAYISVAPKLIGVGQQLTVNLWIYPSPAGPSFYAQEIPRPAWANITVTFTRPDGSKDTFVPTDPSVGLPGVSEAVGNMYFFYSPNQAGAWSVTCNFPGQILTTPPSPDTVYYEPSASQAYSFTVQQDKVVESGLLTGWPWSPLPAGYWQRPVNINNREWSTISGDWPMTNYNPWGTNFNPYSTAPNTAHIVWDNQLTMGGIIGGDWSSLSYGGYGGAPGIIIDGKVYYNDYSGGTFSCRDLRTGELLYRAAGSLSGGQHLRLATGWGGVAGAAGAAPIITTLWSFSGVSAGFADPDSAQSPPSSATWKRYDPLTGALVTTLTNTPTGVAAIWYEEGSPIFYVTQRWGWNTTIPNRYAGIYLIKWDFSRLFGDYGGGVFYGIVNTDWRQGVVWNVTLRQPDGTAPSDGRRGLVPIAFDGANVVVVKTAQMEDMMYGYDMTTGARLWGVNVGFIPIAHENAGPNGPILLWDSTTSTFSAFDVKTGNKLWTSDKVGEDPWGSNVRYNYPVAYGNIYVYSGDGYAYAIDLSNGKIKWKSDSIGYTTETIYGTWPNFNTPAIGAAGGYTNNWGIADGKFYFSTGISWGEQPYSRFHNLWAVDANTGKFLWNITGAFMINGIAEGYLVGTDTLNGWLYTFGKGKTATTVSAPNVAVAKGTGVLIQGTVMDMSPAQPDTPAVAKESMTEWMNYLHMQNASLANNPPTPKGVPVQLFAVDPNGNIQDIGTVTSDSMGHYEIGWTPPVEGTYKILASFAGDDSYWSSSAAAALLVTVAPQTNGGTEQPVSAAPDYTLLLAVIAVVMIVIAILVVYQIVRKKQ